MDPRWEIIFNNRKPVPYEEVLIPLKELNFKKTFKIIHVVGTNGKGSVSNYIAEGLQAQGFTVGLFTSPHIVKPNERIKVNGEEITDNEFFSIYEEISANVHFFAYTYLVAMKHFQNKGCDYVVMEAGIGGRRDLTRLIHGEYGVVTSISKDHTEILGNSLEEIAKDKAGIMSLGMMFAIPSSLDKDLQKIFKDEAKEVGAHVFVIDNDADKYRERNQKLAKGFLKKILGISFKNFSAMPGRTQTFIHNNVATTFDVGHNEDGVKESLKQIDAEYKQVVIAFKDTKDVTEIKNMFKGKKIFYYKVDSHFQDFADFEEIKDLESFYNNQKKSTLYIGSFYLIGELWKLKQGLKISLPEKK